MNLTHRLDLRVPDGPPRVKTPATLTPREVQIIRMIVEERLSNKEIAWRLGLALPTVCNMLGGVYRVLGLQTWGCSRIRLVRWALEDCRFQERNTILVNARNDSP